MFRWPNDDEETEDDRLKRWQVEDPIALQDSYNTSHALVEFCKSNDFEGMCKLVDEAEYGEFLVAHTVQAFMIAVSNLQVDMVRKFLDNCLDITYEVFSDVLHTAVEALWKDPSDYRVTRAKQMIHMLAAGGRGSCGIPVDSLRERDGFTPLCSACVVGFVDVTKCLLSLKADPDMITRANTTPLQIATECGHDNVAALLRTVNAGTSATEVLKKLRPGCNGTTTVTRLQHVARETTSTSSVSVREHHEDRVVNNGLITAPTCRSEGDLKAHGHRFGSPGTLGPSSGLLELD